MSIEIKNISKKFGKVKALESVNIKFEEGKIYGLLGRNGAGKSTVLNIISNRCFADSGSVIIDGEENVENNKALGKLFLMSEVDMYPDSFKVKDMIKWTKEFYPDFDSEKAKNIAQKFNLDVNKKFNSLSTGYKTISKIIVALANNSTYIFLDEPVLGLDANHRELFYRILLEEYTENSRTFVIATHLIEEVAGIIEEVIIINDGKVIENDSTENLLSRGYTVTGSASIVNEFIKDKNVIGIDEIGAVKVAYILGHKNINTMPEGLEVTGLNLQKLFVKMTDEKEALK